MTELDKNAFHNAVTEMVAMPDGPERERALGAVFVTLVESQTISRWAASMAAHSNYHDRAGMDDLQQVIAERILRLLRTATPDNTANVRSWVGVLHSKSVDMVKDYLGSGQVTAAAGMSGHALRRSIIARTRSDLTKTLRREPTTSEIIAAGNEWAFANRKNPVKQGAVLTEKDFTGDAVAFSETVQPMAHTDNAEVHADAMLNLRRMYETARMMYPGDANLTLVVRMWADCVGSGERPTIKQMVKDTGLTERGVRAALVRLNDVLERMRADFGSDR